jgi:ribosomal protein L11 methyltransferase
MSGYVFEQAGAGAIVEALKVGLLASGAREVHTNVIPEEDWAESWKQYFKPRKLGDCFLVLPSWEETPPGGEDLSPIHLDPGQAFGTGDHATTRLCIEYLEQKLGVGDTVLDIGCGSGILSIAAAKLGAENVYATEIDASAAEAARANFERNEVSVYLWQTGDIPDEVPECDLVVSNLVSAILIRIAPAVSRVLPAGGTWILSGVIPDNFADVERAARRAGFTLRERKDEEGWIAARFTKL